MDNSALKFVQKEDVLKMDFALIALVHVPRVKRI